MRPDAATAPAGFRRHDAAGEGYLGNVEPKVLIEPMTLGNMRHRGGTDHERRSVIL
jgi:hypothetical protein